MSRSTAQTEGRIPFRIRIGVTGHRYLEGSAALSEIPERVRDLMPNTSTTPVRIGVVSALAEGADRLVVDEVFRHAARHGVEARLEAVLPFERDRYVELQEFSEAAEAEFDRWLDQASSVTELGGMWEPESRDRAYEAASLQVVARCDVLVALWDGRPSGGRGGTAETLLLAAETGKPCIWVPTYGIAELRDNLRPGTAQRFYDDVRQRAEAQTVDAGETDLDGGGLTTLEGAFAELDTFNRARVPADAELRARAASELGLEASDEASDWIALPFARAAVLADRFQSRFMAATWLMAALATGAAASLGASVTQHYASGVWGWAEVAALFALATLFVAVHYGGLHRRWLSYRLLAERFRSAFFIAPVGIDFRRTAGLETVFVERRSADWLQRAFEEVWESRRIVPGRGPHPTTGHDALRQRLAEDWIGGQIAYHAKACREHERRGFVLTWLVLVCFFGMLAFATLHATTHTGEHFAVLFSITLPVAAGALGVVLTVRQHRALADRYRRMHADLVAVRRSLRKADAQTLGKVAQEAARLIAEENGDWLGAMWFLDVEHPP